MHEKDYLCSIFFFGKIIKGHNYPFFKNKGIKPPHKSICKTFLLGFFYPEKILILRRRLFKIFIVIL